MPERMNPERLLHFATAAYRAAGMPEAEAHLAADTLVQADLWGHQSHGVLEAYIDALHAVPLARDAEAVFYPGEIEARNDRQNRADGLQLPPDTLTDLGRLAAEFGLTL